jgi:hypothetical protein
MTDTELKLIAKAAIITECMARSKNDRRAHSTMGRLRASSIQFCVTLSRGVRREGWVHFVPKSCGHDLFQVIGFSMMATIRAMQPSA